MGTLDNAFLKIYELLIQFISQNRKRGMAYTATSSPGHVSSGHHAPTNVLEARLASPDALPHVTEDQRVALEGRFRECRCPTAGDLILIAAEIGISEAQAKVRLV